MRIRRATFILLLAMSATFSGCKAYQEPLFNSNWNSVSCWIDSGFITGYVIGFPLMIVCGVVTYPIWWVGVNYVGPAVGQDPEDYAEDLAGYTVYAPALLPAHLLSWVVGGPPYVVNYIVRGEKPDPVLDISEEAQDRMWQDAMDQLDQATRPDEDEGRDEVREEMEARNAAPSGETPSGASESEGSAAPESADSADSSDSGGIDLDFSLEIPEDENAE
ncbi:MAG: hypothetical protein NUW37_01180 [Planctomycetes bacterium]|nr:hypothetical protein [Planctomycetota bacterium]